MSEIENAHQAIYNTPLEKRNNDTFLRRDVMLYGWLLQEAEGVIKINRLQHIIGLEEEVSTYLRTTLNPDGHLAIYNLDAGFIRFSDKFIAEIASFLNSPDHGYRLSENLPGSRKTGRDLIEAFAHIRPQPDVVPEITRLIERFSGLTPNLKGSEGGLGEIYQFGENQFSFMVCVCLYDGATTQARLDQIIARLISPLRISDPYLRISKTLLIAPDTDDVTAFRRIVDFDKTYHSWPISFVRLMHGLESLSKEITLDAVRKSFISIFPSDDAAPFSATEALLRIKKKVSEGPYHLPVYVEKTSGRYIIQIGLSKSRRAIRLSSWQSEQFEQQEARFCVCFVDGEPNFFFYTEVVGDEAAEYEMVNIDDVDNLQDAALLRAMHSVI
jgi:hypothetical protein